ncbi:MULTISPECIES: deoxyribonuclease IV [Exiguobacterium]|uniref:Probable endonuclease 4 n=2 Tax=Exiguobacterium TaxID=33986 RepID=U1M160_9BACL|nr:MULTISPECIES: deoxyribonuclease IV [Exiguobacterium]ERG68442.1 endonuclease IV [Exiguobacterium chiriqhucha RW-2]MCT4790144.1 deoxyribonuclease IV [Exiguobacterium mexicanum]TCI72631.1 deoxyribonuclease IV [Exiguobacterium sp. IPCI3]TCI82031.1 deoxyribonuclease IV [Exiguobacterium sp. IPCH1]TCI83536.1 deoxyribonuclease IV [Exiguobacterium sp. IPBC4]
MLKIGSHVSVSGKKMLLAGSEEAVSYGANTMMVYTGAPQNTRRKPIEDLNIEAALVHMAAHDIEEIVVHAPYIINLGNTTKPETFELAVSFLAAEIKRAEALQVARHVVLHPGAHVGAGEDVGLARIIEGLNEVLTGDETVKIALETMAGKGSELGKTFEELATIIDGVTHNDRLSVCFDTCHVHDAGYDLVGDLDGVIEQFDRIVGLDRLGVIHVNDSKNVRGAKKDRHENIGYGEIGFDTLNRIIHHEAFTHLPKILETPYIPISEKTKVAPYKQEIEMFRANRFDAEWREQFTLAHQ